MLGIDFLGVILGGIIIFILADIILKKSIDLAEHWGWSGTFVGLTILSIGTSLPEIMTHVIASIDILYNPKLFDTLSSLVIGTNVGSDIFQQNLVIGVIAILGAIAIKKKDGFKQMGGLIFATALLIVFSIGGIISKFEGFILVAAYIAFLFIVKNDSKISKINARNHLTWKKIFANYFVIAVGFLIMSFIADFILNLSQNIIVSLNISASFFGVIVLGIASALPELSTALISIYKGRKEISASVLIGSNITNPLFALGIGALISSYSVPMVVIVYDLPIKIVTAFMIYYFLWENESIKKWEGIVLILSFFLYLVFRIKYFPTDLII